LISFFRRRQKKIFDSRVITLYLSYSVGLIVPAIMGIILYIQSSSLAEKEYIFLLEKEFTSTSSALSDITKEIDFITTLAKLNNELSDLTKVVSPQAYANAGYYDIYSEHVFESVPLIQHYIQEFQFIFPHNDVVIGSKGVSSLKSFYNYETALAGYSLEDFLSILEHEEKGVPINKYDVISLSEDKLKSRTLIITRFLNEAQFPGFGLFVVNDENIMTTLLELNTFIEGIVFLADSKGEIFYFSNKDMLNIDIIQVPDTIENIKSEKYITGNIVHYQKFFSDLRFTLGTAVSVQKFRQKTSYIRNAILITIFILIVLDIIMLIIVSVLRARPITRMIDAIQTEILNNEDSAVISYKNIDENLKKLLLNKRDLEEQLNQSKPVMISLLLDSLIHGNLVIGNDNLGLFKQTGLFLNADFSCCFIIQYKPSTEFHSEDAFQQHLIKKMMIIELLKTNIAGNLNYLEQGSDRITFIHGGWGVSKVIYYSTLVRELKENIVKLNTQLGMNITARVGNPYSKINKIQQSYEEATLCLDHFSHQPLIEYRQMTTTGNKIFYSFETEIKLMNLIRAGKETETGALLAVLKKRNFQDQILPPVKISIFFNQIKATLSKLEQILNTDNPELEETINQFLSSNFDVHNWELFFDEVALVIPLLSKEFTKSVKTRKSTLDRIAIEEYIQFHFSDSNLSLISFADHFKVSEKYFSKYFKEEFKINFHTYLENVRLNFVYKKLEDNDLPLKDLMKSAGYISQRTFTRAFKKKYGKNPSSYSKKQQQTFFYPD
jgi:AraC-like DNA-binding protein